MFSGQVRVRVTVRVRVSDTSGAEVDMATGGEFTGLNADRCLARMENAETGFSF